MSQAIRGRSGYLGFPIGQKNTNLVEDVGILRPVKFCWLPFRSFRGEVENVSANQRLGRQSWFSDWPEKHKLGRGRWDLTSCQVSFLILFIGFTEEANQRPGWLSSFSIRAEKHKLCRGRCNLAYRQVSLNSVLRFQRKSQKCLG